MLIWLSLYVSFIRLLDVADVEVIHEFGIVSPSDNFGWVPFKGAWSGGRRPKYISVKYIINSPYNNFIMLATFI